MLKQILIQNDIRVEFFFAQGLGKVITKGCISFSENRQRKKRWPTVCLEIRLVDPPVVIRVESNGYKGKITKFITPQPNERSWTRLVIQSYCRWTTALIVIWQMNKHMVCQAIYSRWVFFNKKKAPGWGSLNLRCYCSQCHYMWLSHFNFKVCSFLRYIVRICSVISAVCHSLWQWQDPYQCLTIQRQSRWIGLGGINCGQIVVWKGIFGYQVGWEKKCVVISG